MSNISFDASVKMKQRDTKGYSNHVFRKELTRKINHSNKEIDSARTPLNVDYAIDGKTMTERMDERLADYNGKRKLRNDAVLLRGLVFQPSSDIFEGKTDDEKKEIMSKFQKDLMPWVEENFMLKNVMGMSAHYDETNPHLHMAVMPMTEDGRLSQKDFFKGPKSLAVMHKTLREHMNKQGWSFDVENKHEDAKHYNDADYKRNASAIEQARAEYTKRKREILSDDVLIADIKDDLKEDVLNNARPAIERMLQQEKDRMDERESGLSVLESSLEQRGRTLAKKENEMDDRENSVLEREREVERKREEIEQLQKTAAELIQKAEKRRLEAEKRKVKAEETTKLALEKVGRMNRVLNKIELGPKVKKGLVNYIDFGNTEVPNKATGTNYSYDAVQNAFNKKVTEGSMNKAIEVAKIEDDGPEL